MSEAIRFRRHVDGMNFEQLVDLAESDEFVVMSDKCGPMLRTVVYRNGHPYGYDITICYDAEGPLALMFVRLDGRPGVQFAFLTRED